MAKYKYYDYSQSMMIPVSLDKQLMPGTLEFAIHTLLETRVDTSIFDDRYKNDETGRYAYDPKVLLKIVLLGYSRGLISSRDLERACRENVTFMALSCGQCPDHSTIAAFVSSLQDEIVYLFRDILLVCEQENLLGGTLFALDGCKLPSNASSRLSGRFSELEVKKEIIEKKVRRLLKEQVEADKEDDDDEKDGRGSGMRTRSTQIERLQKKADQIKKWLKDNEPKVGIQGREIRSNVTDNDSTKMLSTHGTIQGYNAQALVDSKKQVILHAEALGQPQDHRLIPQILDAAKENMEAIGCGNDYFCGKKFTADSNYHDPTNLKRCEEEGLDAYIPDKRYRKRDPRLHVKEGYSPYRKKRYTLNDFKYDENRDAYRCPNGKFLGLYVKKAITDGIIYRRYRSEEHDCKGCELKAKCMLRQSTKRRVICVPLGSVPGNLSRAMAAKIDSEKGRKIYTRRLAIVEPVFANIRTHKGMNRFTLRGKVKVNIQWLLYCMVHNIGKLAAYGYT